MRLAFVQILYKSLLQIVKKISENLKKLLKFRKRFVIIKVICFIEVITA